MKIALLVASLLLGSSSMAEARPLISGSASARVSWSFGQEGRPRVRDHRHVPPAPPARYQGRVHYHPIARYEARPVLIASDVALSRDREARAFVKVRDGGLYDSVTIRGAHGRSLIYQVTVEYADGGKTEGFRDLNLALDANESFTLDLAGRGRAIRRIVVYGDVTNASFDVLATRW